MRIWWWWGHTVFQKIDPETKTKKPPLPRTLRMTSSDRQEPKYVLSVGPNEMLKKS